MKAQLTDQVKLYNSSFAEWIAERREEVPHLVAIVAAETRQMIPAADGIIPPDRITATTAAAAGTAP